MPAGHSEDDCLELFRRLIEPRSPRATATSVDKIRKGSGLGDPPIELARHQEDLEAAQRHGREAASILREVGDREGEAEALWWLSWAAVALGDHATARGGRAGTGPPRRDRVGVPHGRAAPSPGGGASRRG